MHILLIFHKVVTRSVEAHLRCSGILIITYRKLSAECASERIVKIDR